MNIVILHLSDLHITNKSAIHMENVNSLVESLSIFKVFEGIILAFSGDIAAKGQMNEYKLATLFIGSLTKAILDKYKLKPENIKILITPGNHDMNREISAQCLREEVDAWYKKAEIDDHIKDEVARMESFFGFANRSLCFLSTNLVFNRKILHFSQGDDTPKYLIEANLFNSSLFSSDNDLGVHYYPNAVFSSFKEPSISSFSITIMHHSPDWFWPEQKVHLHELLYGRSNLVLYGHEHYEATQRIIQNQSGITFIQAGGAWWENNFEDSSYFAGSFDTVSRKYQQYRFTWNAAMRFYEQKDLIEQALFFKCINGSLLNPSDDYFKALLEDEKQPVCGDISRYFVFPKLALKFPGDYDNNKDVNTEDELIQLIESNPQIMIIGSGGSGKTTLLRMLFLRLSQKYTALLCGINEIAGKIQKNIIKETFCSIYGSEPEKYAFFSQQDKKQKVILIDDAHNIKPEHLKKLLYGLSGEFSHIVIASEIGDTFDIRERVCKELELERGICQCTISRLYADKRHQLVRKIIETCTEDNSGKVDEIEFRINNAINTQNLSYKLDPDFIVRFVSYYCTHIRELRPGNINVFSKVFEASIEMAIHPFLRNETVGQIKTALGDVAYYTHFSKKYPITAVDIESVIKDYSEKYEEPLKPTRFFDIVTGSNMLVRCDDCLSYRFRDKDHLAYFTAEAINRRFNEGDPNAENDLNNIVEYSCFSINPAILKFIAYTTGNIRIVELLMHQAISYVKDWPIYDIDKFQFQYLADVHEEEREKITNNSKRKQIEAVAKKEKEWDDCNPTTVDIIDIYDYDENDIVTLNNQLIRALLQMNVISSCLTTFSHMMPAETKRELITALYNMPNQIFYKWAEKINEDPNSLIDEIIDEQKKTIEEQSKNSDKKIDNKVLDRNKVLGALQKSSINLLLNLYYTIAQQCAAPSTIENLARPQYVSNSNQRVERMMFYEQANDWRAFMDEAEELYSTAEDGMIKTIISSMVYHILIWSPSIPREKRHYLMDKFNMSSKRAGILFQNKKNT